MLPYVISHPSPPSPPSHLSHPSPPSHLSHPSHPSHPHSLKDSLNSVDIQLENLLTSVDLQMSEAITVADSQMERTHLDLSNRQNLTSEKIIEIIKAHPNLESLDLSGNNNVDNDVLAAIANCPNLHTLNLSDNRIDNEGAKTIADALRENKTLKVLDLNFNFYSNFR